MAISEIPYWSKLHASDAAPNGNEDRAVTVAIRYVLTGAGVLDSPCGKQENK